MTRSRSPSMLSSRVIGRSSQSGPLQGVVTLGTIGQMALFVSSLKCQHYYDSGHPRAGLRGQSPRSNGGYSDLLPGDLAQHTPATLYSLESQETGWRA